jgi:hypothetical protein
MNLVLKSPNEAPRREGKDVNVLILGENSANTQQACGLLAQVGLNHQAEGRLICSWWNFEVLAITPLRRLAVAEAVAADLVVIAADHAPALPPRVVDWFHQWLGLREDHPRALVALLDSGGAWNGSMPGVLTQLRKLAEAGQLDFYATHARVGLDQGETSRVNEAARELVRDHGLLQFLNE